MSIVDDVRDALKPLGNVVHDVLPGAFASYEGALVPTGTSVAILLNIDDPESYRHEIERLLREAGPTEIRLTLHANPPFGLSSS